MQRWRGGCEDAGSVRACNVIAFPMYIPFTRLPGTGRYIKLSSEVAQLLNIHEYKKHPINTTTNRSPVRILRASSLPSHRA